MVLLESVSFLKVRISVLTPKGRLIRKCIGMLYICECIGPKKTFVTINLKLNCYRVAHKKMKLLESVSYLDHQPVHANHGLSFTQLGVIFSENYMTVMALGIETSMPQFDSPEHIDQHCNQIVSFLSRDRC